MKAAWRRVRPKVLALPAYWVASLLGKSIQTTTIGLERADKIPEGRIFSGWHGRTFLAATLFRDKGFVAIISQSRDGELQNGVFTRFGYRTVRGSTGRGGMQALAAAIRELRKGATMAFTPDGPRGPSGIVQSGIMLMAKKSGAAIVPMGFSCKDRWLAPSWDRFMVPRPFTRGVVILGEPIYVPSDATDDQVEHLRQVVEREMHRLERQAELLFGHSPPDWHATNALTGP